MNLTDKEREDINRELILARHRRAKALEEVANQDKIIERFTEELRQESEPALPIAENVLDESNPDFAITGSD